MAIKPGISYRKRVEAINAIYVAHARSGLSNREIWRRHIYPVYGISERTFYNLLKAIVVRVKPDSKVFPSLFGDDKEKE